jgi:hypothetical protein
LVVTWPVRELRMISPELFLSLQLARELYLTGMESEGLAIKERTWPQLNL